MKPKKRQKICYNCDGDVDIDVIVCPYCAADLREEKVKEGVFFAEKTSGIKDPQKSLYPSHYPKEEDPTLESVSTQTLPPASLESGEKPMFLPTILFTLGVQLCVLGLLMLLFSHKGMVILKWDARLWFVYIGFSIPFLIFGYKSLSKL